MLTRRPIALVALLALNSLSQCSHAPPNVAHPNAPTQTQTPPGDTSLAAPPEPEPTGRMPDSVTPTRYALTLEIVPRRDRFRGTADIRVRFDTARSAVWLHGHELDVTRAEVRLADGSARTARWVAGSREGIGSLRWAGAVEPGEVTLHLEYTAPFGRHLEGLYRVDNEGDAYAFTQFEDIRARRAFPGFDEPRFKTPFDITLVVEEGHRAITNTAEVESAPRPDGLRAVRFAPTEPLPTYLLAFAVGPLDVVDAPAIPANGVRSTPLPFRGVAARGRGNALGRALADTPALVRALEEYFNYPYPYPKLDVIAVPDFGAGAMENAGAITFRESLLLVRPGAPADQPRALAYVMAHELAHHWFGNLVTLRWWDDIWLNESFATWMGTRVTDQVYPRHRQSLSMLVGIHHAMNTDSLSSSAPVRRPIETDADLRGGSSAIVYQKGSSVLGMFERFLGETAFRDALREYMRAHAHGTATSADLFAAFAAAAQGRPVEESLRTFVDQAGVPLIEADVRCDAAGRTLTFAQRPFTLPAGAQAATRTWKVPVCARYPDGATVRERCELVANERVEVSLGRGVCPAWVMPNANAQGYYRWTVRPALLDALRTRAWATLTVPERLSVVNNARAAFTAGALDTAAVLPVLTRAARDPERVVAVEPLGWWSRVITDELTGDAAERARREASRLYAPLWASVGWNATPNEDAERSLLRRDLASFLGLIARDPAVRTEGARRGAAYINASGDGLDPRAVTPELAGAAVAMHLQTADEAASARVAARALQSDDAIVRARLLSSLGWSPEPWLTRAVLPIGLDPRVRVNEVFAALDTALNRGDTRAAAYTWFEANVDAMFNRISRDGRGGTPWVAARFCSREDAERARAFFAPRLAEIPGSQVQLERALETVAVCAAERERQSQSLTAAFGAAAR